MVGVISLLQRHCEVKKFVQDSIASKWPGWNENPATWLQKLYSLYFTEYKYFHSFIFPLRYFLLFTSPLLLHQASLPLPPPYTLDLHCRLNYHLSSILNNRTSFSTAHFTYKSWVRPWVIYPSSPLHRALLGRKFHGWEDSSTPNFMFPLSVELLASFGDHFIFICHLSISSRAFFQINPTPLSSLLAVITTTPSLMELRTCVMYPLTFLFSDLSSLLPSSPSSDSKRLSPVKD